jgi:hypothetical protein
MNRKKQNKRKNPISSWKKWSVILGTLVSAVTLFNQTKTMVSTVYTEIVALSRTAGSAGDTTFTVVATNAAGLSAQANLTIRMASQR